MLYGIDSRQRDKAGFIADKNRYAPWSGAAMSGRLDCSTNKKELTLTRETRRVNAPMGHFLAQYTGTNETVPGLTGQNCGEELLGVPREVYERSAFIRQSGLAISSNSELERRIVSLITTGDEGTSYSEAYAALKKQLNRRRHNKTGELPAAESELAEIRQQLGELQHLQQALFQARQSLADAEQQYQKTQAQLTARKQHDAGIQFAALNTAKQQADDAANKASELSRQLAADRIPENETIHRLQAAISNLGDTAAALRKAQAAQQTSSQALLQAETAANASPFAGMTPEQAEKLPLHLPPQPRFSPRSAALPLLLGLVTGTVSFFMFHHFPTSIAIGLGITAITGAAAAILTSRKHRQRELHAAELRKQRESDLAAFRPLYQAVTAAQAEAAQANATTKALLRTLTTAEEGILSEVHRFAPSAFNIDSASSALTECTARRKALTDAETAAQHAALRWEVLRQQLSGLTPPSEYHGAVPQQTQAELESMLSRLQEEVTLRASAADRLSGQISAAGDPAVLSAQAEALERRIAALNTEYDAIALAMSALDNANTDLQNRFSPALGRRAAEIFRELTENRYSGVVLDRSFRLAAEPTGDIVYRDAQLLSAGATDQLYLAVRLAICELVLPSQSPPPMILDDALANYDDARCAAALKWLRREAENRQILLFTCHSREAEFFQNDPEVHIQRLTKTAQQV